MAYYLHHTINFNSTINENVTVELYKKDSIPTSVSALIGTQVKKSIQSGNGDKFDTILASEATVGIWLTTNDSVTFEDFIVSFYDEWQVKIISDGKIEFIGFLTPGEGECEWHDKPYELQLAVTDGLGFLKQKLLSQVDGTEFRNEYFLIDYVKGCLAKTFLDLDIKIICNIYEISMSDRNADPLSDIFDKIKLDYRTFQSDPTTFVDCYAALTILFSEHFSLYQNEGEWVINRIPEMQSSVGAKNWYSTYHTDGTKTSGQYLKGAMPILQYALMHPRDEDQVISLKFSNKSTKHTYNYTIWPEIFKNITFSRGTLVPALNTSTDRYYTIDDWAYTRVNGTVTPPFAATTAKDYRHDTINAYNVVLTSALELDIDTGFPTILLSSPLPVTKGDKVQFNFDVQLFGATGTGPASLTIMWMWFETLTGTRYFYTNISKPNGEWILTAGGSVPHGYIMNYTSAQNPGDFNPLTVAETTIFPEDGTLFFGFRAGVFGSASKFVFRNFQFTYIPFVVGGVTEVKGDYWFTEQNVNYSDVIDQEVNISDSLEKVFKGALLRGNGTTGYNSPLTVTDWRRLNFNEHRHYKELVNLGRYNASYRRTWKLTGTFGGTTFQPSDDHTFLESISFHRQFYFPQDPILNNYYFMMVPPLSIDYVKGTTTATFVDCYKVESPEQDGNQLGDTHEFKYIF